MFLQEENMPAPNAREAKKNSVMRSVPRPIGDAPAMKMNTMAAAPKPANPTQRGNEIASPT
jgi:hypothetical protein